MPSALAEEEAGNGAASAVNIFVIASFTTSQGAQSELATGVGDKNLAQQSTEQMQMDQQTQTLAHEYPGIPVGILFQLGNQGFRGWFFVLYLPNLCVKILESFRKSYAKCFFNPGRATV